MRLAAKTVLTLITLSLAVTLPACGDSGADAPTAGKSGDTASRGAATDDDATAVSVGDPAGGDRTRVTEPSRPAPVQLPEAPPLTDDAARAELLTALGDLAPEEASRASLLYLAELGDRSIIDAVREQLLAMEGGTYEDPVAAALGLEVLLVLGDKEAVPATLALAQSMLEEEEDVEGIAWALGRIEGARATEADALLAEMAQSDYDGAASAAIEALARRGSRAADAILPGLAADAERYDAVRGSAAAAMLMTGHERAKSSMDALIASDADGSEIIAGLGIPGADVTVPYIQQIMARGLEEGNADLEFAEACYALAAIYGGTSGAARGRDLLLGWLAEDRDLDCDEATYALWVLGDASRTDAAARLLASEVASAARHDPELAVDLLKEVARRGLARDPRFAPAVDAAAVAPPREGLPGLDLSTQQLRAAAAYAYLRSR